MLSGADHCNAARGGQRVVDSDNVDVASGGTRGQHSGIWLLQHSCPRVTIFVVSASPSSGSWWLVHHV